MSEENVETGEETGGQQEQSVPYSRFKQVNDRVAEAERRAEEAQAALQAREEAELSEREKAERAASEALARAEAAEARATQLERSGLVRAAAKNFNDPDDAVALLDLDGIDTAEKAVEAVKQLAESKPHLVKSEQPQAIGAPMSQPAPPEVPTGPDGKPDHKKGLANELLAGVFGARN